MTRNYVFSFCVETKRSKIVLGMIGKSLNEIHEQRDGKEKIASKNGHVPVFRSDAKEIGGIRRNLKKVKKVFYSNANNR